MVDAYPWDNPKKEGKEPESNIGEIERKPRNEDRPLGQNIKARLITGEENERLKEKAKVKKIIFPKGIK